jgi:hypothetical protein
MVRIKKVPLGETNLGKLQIFSISEIWLRDVQKFSGAL